MPQLILERWDGRHWRWWTLLFGSALAIVTMGVAWLIALLIDEDSAALMMLLLLIELLTFSIAGSGLLDSLSRRMSRGGLARETAEIDKHKAQLEAEIDPESEQARRDRRTIRSALLVLPILIAFGYLLFFT